MTGYTALITESKMKKSHNGGSVFEADLWTLVDRFLIIGTQGGSYYQSAADLTKQNLQVLRDALEKDASRLVRRAVEVSNLGLAPKNDQALLAVALATVEGSENERRYAWDMLPAVARIGTHLLNFVSMREALGGKWSRMSRRGVAEWFTSKSVDDLAYQVMKYKQRDGWSMRDVLRLSHPFLTGEQDHVARYVTSGEFDPTARVPSIIVMSNRLIGEDGVVPGDTVVAQMIRDHKLPREVIPTDRLNSVEVWDALLQDMPITALIRNLGKMTNIGLIKRGSDGEKLVVDKLTNKGLLKKGRVHPFSLLVAAKTYGSGGGMKGKLTWAPDTKVQSALDDAFYLSFGNVEPTGKNYLIALDVSASMGYSGDGVVTAREAATAMALITAATEDNVEVVGYSAGLTPLPFVNANSRLDEIIAKTNRLPFSSTDCSLPFRYARQQGKDFDVVVSYTDSETGGGHSVPKELSDYRKANKKQVKSAVVAFTANNISIADPRDPFQLDIAGLDASLPQTLSAFSKLGD